MLDRATHRRRRAGAPMKYLAHSASFHSGEKSAPSKPGTKHLDALEAITRAMVAVETEFENLTSQIQIKFGNPTNMMLGWGVTRGHIIKTQVESGTDYLGHHINKAARLCELARPRGVVVDRDDFP